MTKLDSDHRGGELLITGATGMIGGLVVSSLVERGVALTAMVRPGTRPDGLVRRPGVRVVEGDFDDRASLDLALRGVKETFLLTNSSERTERQQLAFVEAARAAGVSHLVKLSQLHAAADSSVRFLRYHAAVEAAVERSDIPYTFIRPNLILQAYLPFAPGVQHGSLPAPISDTARVSVVDARDIAAVAAAALTEPGHEGCSYDVTGPESVTHPEIAQAFAQAAEHKVRFDSVPADQFISSLLELGMPAWQAEGLAEDYAHYDRGEAAGVSDDVRKVTGRAARSLHAFAIEHAAAFRARQLDDGKEGEAAPDERTLRGSSGR